MVHNQQKPTKAQVDALLAEGFSTRQIAQAYGWSASSIIRIHHAKDRLELQKEQRTDWKMPITEEERMEARRKCRIGDKLMVFNHWKSKKKEIGYGVWEISRIKHKFRYIVLLENGRTVDYAEVARQRRGERDVNF